MCGTSLLNSSSRQFTYVYGAVNRAGGEIEEVLASQSSDDELDRNLRKRNLSLRAVVREIPLVFASI
jgi:hypothetical protein